MALGTVKFRSNTGKIAAANVAAPADYDALVGTATPVYADVSGNIAVSVADVATGFNAMVRDNFAGDSIYGQLSMDVRFSAIPSTAMEIVQLRNASAKITNILASSSTGNPTITIRGGGDVNLFSAVTLALDTWYRVEIALEVGTTTTGKTKGRITRLSDSTVMGSGELTNLNNGTANTSFHQSGKVSTTGTVGLLIDNLALFDAAYDYIGLFPPTNLAASTVSPTAVDLEWDAVPTATGYDVERDTVVIATDVATTTYSDTGLTASTAYDYRVRAVK